MGCDKLLRCIDTEYSTSVNIDLRLHYTSGSMIQISLFVPALIDRLLSSYTVQSNTNTADRSINFRNAPNATQHKSISQPVFQSHVKHHRYATAADQPIHEHVLIQ